MVMIMMPVTNAIMEPTERSSPPEEMTKVAPTAMIAMKADRVITLIRFAPEVKFELISAPRRTITASAMNGAKSAQRMRLPSSAVAACAVAVVMCLLPRRPSLAGCGGIDDGLFIDLVAVQFRDDPLIAHDEHSICETDKLLHFRRDDDAGLPLPHHLVDEVINLAFVANVDAARRLVDNLDRRVGHHHLGKQGLLLIAAGQLASGKA